MRHVVPLCLLALPLLAGCLPPPATSGVSAPASSAEPDLVGEIVAHPFWKKKPTREAVERLVAKVLTLKRDGYVIINERGETETYEGSEAFTKRVFYREISQGRLAVIDMDLYPTAPDRTQILRQLKREIDQADFRPVEKELTDEERAKMWEGSKIIPWAKD